MADSVDVAAPLLSLEPELQEDFQRKVQNIRRKSKVESITPGVIYLGHIPKILHEPQLTEYFNQFGTVTRLRLSRSKKTGGSKGYGFVEFECDEVAKIVASTMNNYLFCERLLKCEFIPPEKVPPRLFIGSETIFKKPSLPAVTRYNRKRSFEEQTKMKSRLLEKETRLRKRLAEKGIDYDFPGFAAQKKQNLDCTLDLSVNSQDATPVCTPSILERRKSARLENEDQSEDDEIVLKMPEMKSLPQKKTKLAKPEKKMKIKKKKVPKN
ncbi:MKI67 FHA domain-interacting nucleolar phospho [Pelobates cultripes]|uniref:MKI67 FHA domain-interacting nucleolar phospho n=1 Tax=Pelobates cultripes TaxID=61616 RepID=A0AAD1WGS2_PELCU|nr:MKI67 FHA domain-interacting nucleolar phospho [Pelobates cultripes]CAH2305077.1 MKI67 FHA domain-interacting nucleolar phospho [Pelobates cultripes]CAH2305078.1 MKI67 FHA domain-interacting nucleolar phospho [Pelobates cultripes]CAH2305079.1 MKI67 FHA domain-interacting nucleolar phospho [Pelobates cultripes]CAH2305080.1 MKI67 FHA domain-interacting nucleolar phospho [Pelobates cultripes]